MFPNLPAANRPPPRRILYVYERMMGQVVPILFLFASIYTMHVGTEYILAPFVGRSNWANYILFGWSSLLVLLGWLSFYLGRTTDPGSIPSEIGHQMPPEMRNQQNWCDQCENVKPPRAHHCRRCKRCIIRMDNHCVILNNCVGLYNWKYFVSTFVYLFLASVNGLLLMSLRFYYNSTFNPDTNERIHCIIFTLLCSFFGWIGYKHGNMHLNLAMLNLTSIEYLTLPAYISLNFCQRYGIKWSRISNYDKGWRHNLIMVLGEPAITWFMPWVKPRSPWGPLPCTCKRRKTTVNRDVIRGHRRD